MLKKILAGVVLFLLIAPCTMAEETPEPVTSKTVLNYLEDVITWRRDLAAFDTVPGNSLETLLKTTLQKNSIKVLKYGFEFGRAQAIVLGDMGTMPKETGTSQQQELATATKQVADLIPQLNAKITDVDTALAKAPADQHDTLAAKREKLTGELKLATARQDLLKSVTTAFADSTVAEDATDLIGQINNLARTLPELATMAKKPATAKAATPPPVPALITPLLPVKTEAAAEATEADQGVSTGVLRLTNDIMAIYRKKKDLAGLTAQTTALVESNQKMIDALRLSLRAAIAHGNDLTNTETKSDISNLDQQLDDVILDFKRLSDAIVPLGKVKYWLTASNDNVQEWQNSLDTKLKKSFRTLTIRLIILGIALLVPLAISEALRRTTNRYIHDHRRQRQLNIVRRIVFSVVIGIIILLNVITEFGSLATYIGLLTAGLAVALQNVILSMVSYFFYFGRFGVRVGDRVTIGTVTGEVVQVGLVRLYLMELGGPDSELHPTGKIIAFPNSILFQPAAFSKQVPGTNYTWRKITFILDANTDYKLANKKLMEAVQAIYEDYHEIMDHQQEALIRATHMNVKIPPPRGYIQFLETGLAFVIRYPIEISRAAEINERITKKIVDTIHKEPSLKLVSSNPPRIQRVDPDEMDAVA